MPRSRRLPPSPVTYLEKYHAYTSPPLPEDGGLPTIIVTPAESAQASDFEIHFYSPKPIQTSFQTLPFARGPSLSRFVSPPDYNEAEVDERGDNEDGYGNDDDNKGRGITSKGVIPRLRSLIYRITGVEQSRLHQARLMEKDESERNRRSGTELSRSSGTLLHRTGGNGGYLSLKQSEDDSYVFDIGQSKEDDYEEDDGDALDGVEIHGVPTISEQEWQAAMMINSNHQGYHYHHQNTQPSNAFAGNGDSTALELTLGGQRRLTRMSRRARTLAILSIPVLLLALHLIHHQFAWFFSPSERGGDGRWVGEPTMPLSGPSI